MKVFAFQTCKGLLKISADSREQAISFFKILVRKNKRAEYVPIGRERMERLRKMLYTI